MSSDENPADSPVEEKEDPIQAEKDFKKEMKKNPAGQYRTNKYF